VRPATTHTANQLHTFSAYRFHFNGGEAINEVYGNDNYVDLGERGVDTRLGKLNWSIDPRAAEYPWQSPYAYYANSPIWQIDYKGEGAGDFYNSNGEHLGSDGETDDKVYVADDVKKDEKGLVVDATNKKELKISHTEFRKQAATVYGESSAYKMNKVTDNLKKEMFAIASVHQRNKLAYGADSDKAKEYLALTPSQVNKSQFKTTANAAIINALTDGFDYSYGATMWDGAEQGLFPSSNNDRSVFYKNKSFELHMNTMGWNISDSHYMSWKANIGPTFKAPKRKVAPANFGKYQNKGLIRLQSTAVYGETIFWKEIQ
jgi:hypothetical protein